MIIQWLDVSIPLREGMAVWPGDRPFSMMPNSRVAAGDGCNTSRITLGTHTGTHCDAPWHFEADGKRLHEVDTAVFFGDALVIDLPDIEVITASDLADVELPGRVLFRTRNSALSLDAPFQEDFVALDDSAARCLVAAGVRLVGVDYLSVAPFGKSAPTHHTLLSHDVFVVEGLRLGPVTPGLHPFTVLPMPIHNADGAPCRAFIGMEKQ